MVRKLGLPVYYTAKSCIYSVVHSVWFGFRFHAIINAEKCVSFFALLGRCLIHSYNL